MRRLFRLFSLTNKTIRDNIVHLKPLLDERKAKMKELGDKWADKPVSPLFRFSPVTGTECPGTPVVRLAPVGLGRGAARTEPQHGVGSVGAGYAYQHRLHPYVGSSTFVARSFPLYR